MSKTFKTTISMWITVAKGLTSLFLGKVNWHRSVVLTTSHHMAVWKSKELLHMDTASSLSWSQYRDFFGDTEDFIWSIKDEVINQELPATYDER